MPKHTEAQQQRLFVKRWRLDPRTRDLPATAIPLGMRTSALQATLAKADGASKGAPDWLCFQQGVEAWNGLALEFKRPDGKGRVSPEQKVWHQQLRHNGWRVEIVTSAEQAWAVVEDYFNFKD